MEVANEPNHAYHYGHWYQWYDKCGVYYLCTSGLYCPLEKFGDPCCICGSFKELEDAERSGIDRVCRSVSKGLKLLS
ncbi:hypothetical protein DMN91_000881 [Ooceraea biroi]|uniref:Uncharacterized protein n=4 Tax=Ooceraea biroi TaxID=2015173 RepID=A0A3L8E3G3_OOCBI|nr:hypothetical protein DMN91_000881 [Ooceraea biroi]